MDFNISDLLFYFSIVALQFGDWWTTKIFVASEGVEAEANPIGRNEIKRDGVSLGLLVKKLFIGAMAIVLIATSPKVDIVTDMIIGASFWLMLHVALNNASLIFSKRYMSYMEIPYELTKHKAPYELAEKAVSSAFREMTLCLFLISIGIWIYAETGRAFLFSAAFGSLALVFMETLTAREHRNKAFAQKKQAEF